VLGTTNGKRGTTNGKRGTTNGKRGTAGVSLRLSAT
jgi:hypothetical protein